MSCAHENITVTETATFPVRRGHIDHPTTGVSGEGRYVDYNAATVTERDYTCDDCGTTFDNVDPDGFFDDELVEA